jgi:hypothetical protein
MLLYAGIDEAGYGPMLGPLCVGMSVFLLERHDPSQQTHPPDLWAILSDGVCSSPRDKRRRVAVADSKRLKGANNAKSHPLRHLERGVLTFHAAIDGNESLAELDDATFFGLLGAELPTTVSTPWYASSTSLPVAHDEAMIAIAAARLRTTLDAAGVRIVDIGLTSIDAGELNRLMSAGANKATINQDAILGLIARVRRVAEECNIASPRIVIDRQGGRTFYRSWLSTCLPTSSIRILGETERISRYEVTDDFGTFVVSFETKAETRHLPVALASMAAKYARELAMIRFNRYFLAQLPQLRPTAGYVQDGRRFMQEVKPLLEELNLERGHLVRQA